MPFEELQSEAPDCRGCGRRMTVEATSISRTGYGPDDIAKRVSLARCVCCPIIWDDWLGWLYVAQDDGCEHVEFECRRESCPRCGAPQIWLFLDLRSCRACEWQTETD